MRLPSVTFFAEGGPTNPCPWYRAFLPARALQIRAWPAFVATEGFIAEDGRFATDALDRPTDIAVIRRPVQADGVAGVDYSAEVIAARAAGQRIYVDLDDNLYELPPTSPAKDILGQESLEALTATVNASDGVLCSTPGLATALRRWVDVPRYVCPNGIDPALFPLREGEHTPLRIGWLGPWKWRRDDLASVSDWLGGFLNARTGKVEFWHLGAMPDDEGTIQDVLIDLELPVTVVPWFPFPCLPQSLAEIDVLIIPQRTGADWEAFADSRSPTTAIAAVASGAVVWATPIDSYRRLFGAALPAQLADIVDDKAQRRQYRRAQRKILSQVNLAATATAYEKVFLAHH